MLSEHPEVDVLFVETGGDNLTLTFSPLLVDRSIYVLDVAAGDKTPRKRGPGMIHADLLVINKIDLAPHVGADLSLMERDVRALRDGPVLFTDCRHGRDVDRVVAWIEAQVADAAAAG
jgi:urease accessory protein